MNGVVVNIRGMNASGKSTMVREFCRKYSLQPQEVIFKGKKFKTMFDGKRLVMGWYQPFSTGEGCDALKADKEEFREFLRYSMDQIKPTVIVYEKQIWSNTYKFTGEISEMCDQHGYGFIAIQMLVRYETALNRLLVRNGGRTDKLRQFDKNFRAVRSSAINLKKAKKIVFDIDSEEIPIENTWRCIDEAIMLFYNGERGGKLSGLYVDSMKMH